MKKVLLSTIMVLFLSLTFTSCRDTKEKTEDTIEEAMDNAGDAIDEAGDAVEDAANEAGQEIEEEVDGTDDVNGDDD